jgi:nitroreductase
VNFIDLALKRQSVRAYNSKPVEQEKINRCLEAARIAPSACNAQPWYYIVFDEPDIREKVARETYSSIVSFNKFALQAPVIVMVVMEKPTAVSQIGGRIKKKEYALIDIGISAEHFCLQAVEEGLGTCMMGWFNEKKLKKMLNIPDQRSIVLLITLGYPADEPRTKKRKSIEETAQYNQYKKNE